MANVIKHVTITGVSILASGKYLHNCHTYYIRASSFMTLIILRSVDDLIYFVKFMLHYLNLNFVL
jgi:hypothetical protein